MNSRYSCTAAIAFCIAAVPALAQRGGWLVAAPAVVQRSSPEVEIRVYAWFDRIPGVAELFAQGSYHLRASDPMFLDYYEPPGILGPHPRRQILPMAIDNLGASQLHFPPSIVGNPVNPILVLVAEWQPTDFTPRVVTITAHPTINFSVFRSMNERGTNHVPNSLPGVCEIQVIDDCYADCDASSGSHILDIFDFLCFQNHFANQHGYACDCDTTSGPALCDIFDFLCFQNRFVTGCP